MPGNNTPGAGSANTPGAGSANTPGAGSANTPGAGSANTPEGGTSSTWAEILAGLPEDQQALYQQDTQGLRSALQSERERARDFSRQFQEATTRIESGDTEAQQELARLREQLDQASQRAAFLEEATQPEIGCVNPHLAWLAAQDAGAIDGRGRVRWDDLRTQYPQLFRQTTSTAGNAGAGTQQQTETAQGGMDELIRRRLRS